MYKTQKLDDKPTIEIVKHKNGCYNFENVPQEHNYVKIFNLFSGTDRKAINQAKRINPHFNYIVAYAD